MALSAEPRFNAFATPSVNPAAAIGDPGISERAKRERLRMKEAGKLSLEGFRKAMDEVKGAENAVLRELLPEDEAGIGVNEHIFESDLTGKNKTVLSPILSEIGILFVYQCEGSGEENIVRAIDLLSPDMPETDRARLRIHVKRRSKNLPFFIEKIEITDKSPKLTDDPCE